MLTPIAQEPVVLSRAGSYRPAARMRSVGRQEPALLFGLLSIVVGGFGEELEPLRSRHFWAAEWESSRLHCGCCMSILKAQPEYLLPPRMRLPWLSMPRERGSRSLDDE